MTSILMQRQTGHLLNPADPVNNDADQVHLTQNNKILMSTKYYYI
jgi:hypothetical protein